MAFKTKKFVTLPHIKLAPGKDYYLRFDTAMHLGKAIEKDREPATLAQVTDMETGEVGEIICSQLLRENLNEAYPKDAYVGLVFHIRLTKVPDKKYNLVHIAEVEVEDEEKSAASVGAKKPKAS